MAKISALAKLFQSIAGGDLDRARLAASSIADAEEHRGHHNAAATLRGALSATKPREDVAVIGNMLAVQPDLLVRLDPGEQLDAVVLPANTRRELLSVVNEIQNQVRLSEHGLRPRSRLFFHGPPGCGKTFAARALGVELGLPVLVVRFDMLVGAYLGQTSLRLGEVFRFAETNPCVLLVDELDAVGVRRGGKRDIGELDRIVISFMQQLDLVKPAALLIAASNLPDALDPALLRRFDESFEFPSPSTKELRAYASREARRRGIRMNGAEKHLSNTTCFADAARLVEAEHRRIVLRGETGAT